MDVRTARRRQTIEEAERLKKEVTDWLTLRKNKDVDSGGYRGRYETQMSSISTEVSQAVDRVRTTAAETIPENRATGDVFKEYNLHDQRLIWIRYAWDYFRDKLDQRDDENLKPILEAADEVCWTSYATFFRSAGLSVPAAPIPYIEYDYVPSALRVGQSHILSRKPGADAGPLKEYFKALPVPLLRLPPGVTTSPWSLALICHEVGHILQEYVEPNKEFFTTFSDLVSSAIKGVGGTTTDEKTWARWSQEIFADMCMAVTTGPWSVWAIAPWVVTEDAAMKQPFDNYPPPIVRLSLLDRMSRAAEMPEAQEIFQQLQITTEDFAFVNAVADIAKRQLTINQRKRTLGGFLASSAESLGKTGRISQWASQLLGKGDLVPESDKTSARDAVVAAVKAHFLSLQTDTELDSLRTKCTSLIRDCHDSGVRAGTVPRAPDKSLSDSLFKLSEEDLLAPGMP